jgi:hypothetical protein
MMGSPTQQTPSRNKVVACLGESLTKGGRVSYDWFGDLAQGFVAA